MGKIEDLTGQRFGRLTVIERAENKGKKTCWKCHCDCGNETVVCASHLKSGATRSCGCFNREIAHINNLNNENLIGQKFGRYTVISFDGRRNGSIFWKCRCDCGNERSVSASHLKSGASKSCGCLNKEKISERNLINLVGQRFGKLTVIERAESASDGKIQWRCKCECGNEVVARGELLRNGKKKSCG